MVSEYLNLKLKMMKTDVNGCSTCPVGQEHYEIFRKGRINFYQYDYRHTDGELFSTIAITLAVARERKDDWVSKKEGRTI